MKGAISTIAFIAAAVAALPTDIVARQAPSTVSNAKAKPAKSQGITDGMFPIGQ